MASGFISISQKELWKEKNCGQMGKTHKLQIAPILLSVTFFLDRKADVLPLQAEMRHTFTNNGLHIVFESEKGDT
ncbi:hypothetical protein GCM10020331_088940 [Ectobacillus funiculus]